jgi:hypothetical protein
MYCVKEVPNAFIQQHTANSMVVCVHDIPVNIIGRRHWTEYKQPELPLFDVRRLITNIKL